MAHSHHKGEPHCALKGSESLQEAGHTRALQAVKLSTELEKPYEVVAAGKQFAETSAEGGGSGPLELHLLNAWMSPRKNQKPAQHCLCRKEAVRVKHSGGHQVRVSHVLSMAGLCALTRNASLVLLPPAPGRAIWTHAPVSIRQCQSTQANEHADIRGCPRHRVTHLWLCLSITRTKAVASAPSDGVVLPQMKRAQWTRLSIKGVHLLMAGGNWGQTCQSCLVYTSVSAVRISSSPLHRPKTLSGDWFQENKGKDKDGKPDYKEQSLYELLLTILSTKYLFQKLHQSPSYQKLKRQPCATSVGFRTA